MKTTTVKRLMRRIISYNAVRHTLAKLRNWIVSEDQPVSTTPLNEIFHPEEDQWVRNHYIDVVDRFVDFVRGSEELEGKRLLDVGSGDCIVDYGLLSLPLKHVQGLDIVPVEYKSMEELPGRIERAGCTPPEDLSRFSHAHYDGARFPFEDDTFDIVFSWSAFEHVTQVREALQEIARVLRPDGFAFIQVYPWYQSRPGSHLMDHVDVPFFHLRWGKEEVREKLEEVANRKIESKVFLLGYLWDEFTTLNKFSADSFYECAKDAGLRATKARLISHDEDLSCAPKSFKLSELMVAGTMMILKHAKVNT